MLHESKKFTLLDGRKSIKRKCYLKTWKRHLIINTELGVGALSLQIASFSGAAEIKQSSLLRDSTISK